MTDAAHSWTDERIEVLEREASRDYVQAIKDAKAGIVEALKSFDAERKHREKALDDAPESRKAHAAWLEEESMRLDKLNGLLHSLTERTVRANETAMTRLNEELPGIYSENANRAAYEVESAVGRNLGLLSDSHDVKPAGVHRPKVDRVRDFRWNFQKFVNAVTQGILHGEGIGAIMERVKSVIAMNYRTMRRVIRTAATRFENAGRLQAYKTAQAMGFDVMQEWRAILDNRTRHSHRQLDGERVPVGELFSNGLRYPGDPEGPPHEVFNCRCALKLVMGDSDIDVERYEKLPDGMTYEEWKALGLGRRDDGTIIPDPQWSNAAVEALSTAAEVCEYIETNHGLAVLGNFSKVPIEHLRGIAAGLDEAQARFGHGAATTLKINNRLVHPGKYYYDTGTIEIKTNKGGTFLTAMHEYVHSVDDLKSAEICASTDMIISNAYSSLLVDRACRRLGVQYGSKEYVEILDRMCGMNQVLRNQVDLPHELLAHSVERERVGRRNELTSILVEMLEADRA